jgi:hypothetical protein
LGFAHHLIGLLVWQCASGQRQFQFGGFGCGFCIGFADHVAIWERLFGDVEGEERGAEVTSHE